MGQTTTPPPETNLPGLRQALPRILLRLAVVALVIAGTVWALHWFQARADAMDPHDGEKFMIGVYASMLVVYALLMAVPFVPGVEIGLTLLILCGAAIAPWVWLATMVGLGLAFVAGRCLPYAQLRRVLADLRMARLCALLERVEPLPREDRLALLDEQLPGWLRPLLAGRGRYVLLAVLVALPGNGLIGGGGGISFMAGLSRLFSAPLALSAYAVAVLPLPLLVWLYGRAALAWL